MPDSINIEYQALAQSPEWYASEEGINFAERLLLLQHDNGGWRPSQGKKVSTAPVSDDERTILEGKKLKLPALTGINDRATFTEMEVLARAFHTTGDRRFAESVEAGIDYLLDSQLPCNGWRLFWPVYYRSSYLQHVSFKDEGTLACTRLLQQVADGETLWNWVDLARQDAARQAATGALGLIAYLQIDSTGWAIQYHRDSLQPMRARVYEPEAIDSLVTTRIIRYLRTLPSDAAQAAASSATEWLRGRAIHGIRWGKDTDFRVQFDADAPPMWARFYEIGTNRPLFGDSQGNVSYTFLGHPGYAWYVYSPAEVLSDNQ